MPVRSLAAHIECVMLHIYAMQDIRFKDVQKYVSQLLHCDKFSNNN